MYTELFTNTRTYRGELVEEKNNCITILCGVTNELVNIPLQGEYCLYKYENVLASSYLYRLDHIIVANKDDIFTAEDRILIANSNDVVKIYQILHSLRSLGFNFNRLEDIKLAELKVNINQIINKAYKNNISEIKQDDELTLEEKTVLINTIKRSKKNYLNILKNTHDVRTILSAFPPMFNEDLLYLTELVRYIDEYYTGYNTQ